MSLTSRGDMLAHLGHDIEMAAYGFDAFMKDAENATIECTTCCVVLIDSEVLEALWRDAYPERFSQEEDA